METVSLTFGDVAENHKGMQKIGNMSEDGFALNDLVRIQSWFESKGGKCVIYQLHDTLVSPSPEDHAYLLVVKTAVNLLLGDELGADRLYQEQRGLETDKKAFMYGRVVNKHARHNLCFGEEPQKANYEQGMGTIYAFRDVPLLNQVRAILGDVIGPKGTNLQAEGNYYYDITKCGIGYHGDSERKKVVAIRLGAPIPLYFTWYHDNQKISRPMHLNHLSHGDMYVMSEKATGFDWRSKSKRTLRHAAGCAKYTNP